MNERDIKIAPSILSADFGYLADEAKRIEDSGANQLHIDVMDGNFVPNLTMGFAAVAAINRATKMFLDVHIMVYHPYDYIERMVESGADKITFHFEATEDVEETLLYIRKCNIEAGLAFNPETSMSLIPKYLDKCDSLLIMTVHPGFGGQAFMPEVVEKISFVRDICNKLDIRKGGVTPKAGSKEEALPIFDIGVDGGIDHSTAEQCVKAGANILISGSYLFKTPTMADGVKALRAAAKRSLPK